ncbi:ABC transporter ATP-binding protein [Clostridium uliginosum]|uniref:Iron complex transport system ATP-binding protein n=1 Tax=Clostridium uliginosum TaxID=119641 RepID=A0A1I1PHU7_9CLOT|nr:ABC transporter ATP-binding protein [Clostridium uliginosum]SFD09357.1 iron complex transport system ATP-binding protein [Clostridium uliginosum]
MIIDFKEIDVVIGNKQILTHVNLRAQNNKITGIIGPNGSGKSTLIKTFFGLVSKKNGKILLDDIDVSNLSKKEIATYVGYVGQDSACIFDFSVRDVVSMALYPRKKIKGGISSRECVDNALAELELNNIAERNIQTLSGGERKMVFLARAIAQGVDTIILDEPTNHLDIKHQLFILDYLKKSKKTVIIVLHDLQLATHYCDELYLLKNGKNIANGIPIEVLSEKNIKNVFDVSGMAVLDESNKVVFKLNI